MKNSCVSILYGMVLFVLGCICYDLHSKQHSFVTVDTHQIIRQAAEGLAKSQLTEEQLQRRLHLFKTDLEKSLSAFSKKQCVTILSKQVIHGDLIDQTESFITFYNNETSSGNDHDAHENATSRRAS